MKSTKYVEDYCRDLKFKNYCDRTIQNYACQVSLFLNKFSHLNDPKRVTESQIKNWVSDAKTVNSIKHRLSALKLFYKYTVKQPMKLRWVEYPRAERKLPIPLEVSDIQKMIAVCQNLKHKAIICLLYSTGIRVSELINLKISDIDSKKNVIYIRQAKGKKDRQVPLDPYLLEVLRKYYVKYNPKEFLFNGQFSQVYSQKSVNEVLKQLAHKAKIGGRVYAHLLRHSNATHLLESGTDISVIQRLLGHNSPKTTQIYTHISSAMVSKVKTPLSRAMC